MAESFRDLETWQRAMDLAVLIDDLVDRFTRENQELKWQMRGASMSIPFNVAEGYRRRSTPAYLNHLSIAMGSQGELDTALELVLRTKRQTMEVCKPAIDLNRRVGWLLFRLYESQGGTDRRSP